MLLGTGRMESGSHVQKKKTNIFLLCIRFLHQLIQGVFGFNVGTDKSPTVFVFCFFNFSTSLLACLNICDKRRK